MNLVRLVRSAAGAAAVVGLGLMPVTAQAQVVTVTAQLTGAEENPGISTGAHGNATVTIDRAAQKITYRVNVYNLPSGLTGSHIHVGPVGQNGPIIFNFTVTANVSNDFAIVGEVTAADLVARPAQGINSFEDAIFAIASGNAYVNVHTAVNAGGEIRGQLCPTSAKANLYNNTALCTSTQ